MARATLNYFLKKGIKIYIQYGAVYNCMLLSCHPFKRTADLLMSEISLSFTSLAGRLRIVVVLDEITMLWYFSSRFDHRGVFRAVLQGSP